MFFGILASVAFAATTAPHAPSTARTVAPAARIARATATFQRLTLRGITSVSRSGLGASERRRLDTDPGDTAARPSKRGHAASDVHKGTKLATLGVSSPAIIAAPAPRPIVGAGTGFSGFDGLSHFDQRTAGTGAYVNTQFSLEPPDQGLCVGNGFVVEAVNNALAVYDTNGKTLGGPTSLSQFFGLAPEINRKTGARGPFISDPRCRFDSDTQRWFVTELEFAANGTSAQLIAVSQTSDPTGAYSVLSFDTTDPGNPGCPCFGDQPLIGTDAYGFYVTTNEFPLATNGFNGAQIYALSKRALAAGTLPTVVHINAGALPTPDGGSAQWYTIQPATAASAADEANAASQGNGTEFFLSSLDFSGQFVGQFSDNRIAAWALTGTNTLAQPAPTVALQNLVIPAMLDYSIPPNATQKPGPTPLGTSLGAPLESLQTNDDRMQQVVYAAGRLWSGFNTAVRSGTTIESGLAYVAVGAHVVGNGDLKAKTLDAGYVVAAGENLLFPSIGVNANGMAVMASSLSGPDYYPSVVYTVLGGKKGVIHLAGIGAAPDDGFTAYPAFGGNGAGRWGDYSAAVVDADGSIWFAAEYVPGLKRTVLANWGTFVGRVGPEAAGD